MGARTEEAELRNVGAWAEAWEVGSRGKRWVPKRNYTKQLDKQIFEHFLPYHTEFSTLFWSPQLIKEVWDWLQSEQD